MKAIIFGINGQDGFYLGELLASQNVEVTGVSRSANKIFVQGNVKDIDFVTALITKLQPDFVFHLAANSTTKHEALFENHETISTGTLNILEAVYKFSSIPKFFYRAVRCNSKIRVYPSMSKLLLQPAALML